MKKKMGIIIAAVCLAGGLMATAAFLYFKLTNSPLYRMSIGVKKLMEEVETTSNPIFTNPGLNELVNVVGKENAQAKYSLNISKIPILKGMTLGFDGEILRDMENRKGSISGKASVAGLPLLSAIGYVQDEKLFLQMPDVYDGSVTFNTNDIDGQYNNSAIQKYIGESLKQDVSIDMFTTFTGLKRGEEGLLEKYHGDIRALLKDIHLEEDKNYCIQTEKEELLQDAFGNAQEITAYILTLEPQVLDLPNTIKFRVLLNEKNRIIMLETVEEMSVLDYQVGGSVLLLGQHSSIEDLYIDIRIAPQKGEVQSEIALHGTLRYEEEEDQLSANLQGNLWDKGMKAVVSIEEVRDGEQANIILEELRLYKQEKELVCITGNAEIALLDQEIAWETGEEYAIFRMNELQLIGLIWKCKENLGGVTGFLFDKIL